MSNGNDNSTHGAESASSFSAVSPPSISLPKGGGAIQGIGEKFAANPVTGTGSLSIPITTSPGRSGFSPQLALAYDSGSGNGPFGFSWNLSIPSITRKTDKGLPKYQDVEESDVFILSGAEDLVPVLVEVGGQWQRASSERMLDGVAYAVQRYRPRIEGLFARIERWTDKQTGETHWRSISRDNVTTVYGKRSDSRIADPDDPSRVFSWLICESYGDKGNAILYQYKAEDADNIDPTLPQEKNRLSGPGFSQRYLKRIHGNHAPHSPGEDLASPTDWLFEAVFDYGEHDVGTPTPEEAQPWPVRQDPFSTYRAGFETRTYRLCRRILMFHHFAELGDTPCLVRSTDFVYSESPIATFITSTIQAGYVRKADGRYRKKSFPPQELSYSQVEVDQIIRSLDAESVENLSVGLQRPVYQWVDLDGEGMNGVLSEQADNWFYKRNLGNGTFGPLNSVAPKPSLSALGTGRQQFMDLAGDGQVDLVELNDPVPGFYERGEQGGWKNFIPFESELNVTWNNPNLRFVDLTGDGRPDVLISEDNAFTWYPSRAEQGFDPAEQIPKQQDEEKGPNLVFADGTESIYLADMSGDGLTDLVRIRNGEVCYWPNLGYGRFGTKVTMDNAPRLDAFDQFDQRRIRLGDIDGTGVIDIIYLGRDSVDLYFNRSGNSLSAPKRLKNVPPMDNIKSVTVADLLGNGTACIVWSSALPGDARQPVRYIDLMGGQKPHLLIAVKNNLGAETRIHYAASTKFYQADRAAGTPWITKLPFPVHVVERVESFDWISNNRFVTHYTYHHGFYDGVEREFHGFGMVEQLDTEEFATPGAGSDFPAPSNIDSTSHVPPVLTRTWFHTGAYLRGARISLQFKDDYYREPGLTDAQFDARLLPDTILPPALSPEEQRQAARALKGTILRQEIYAQDGSTQAGHPYTVSERNYTVKRVQPLENNRHGVFFVHAREAVADHYERIPADPRVSHQLVLEVDAFGNVLKSAAVVYPRRSPDGELPEVVQAEQAKLTISYSETDFTNDVVLDALVPVYRLRLPYESRSYELTGLQHTENQYLGLTDLIEASADADEIPYEAEPTPGLLQKRLIERVQTLYSRNDLSGPLPSGRLESLALPFESYGMAFTPALLETVYGERINDDLLIDEGRYLLREGVWWIPSGRQLFDESRFYLPVQSIDPFGQVFVAEYDDYALLMEQTEDPLHNIVSVDNDYRTLQARRVTDPNGNRSEVAIDALGLVVGTAVMGKEGDDEGDSLQDFVPDLDESVIVEHIDNPLDDPGALLQNATTRLVYDLHRYQLEGRPTVVYTLARETHAADLNEDEQTKIQHSFAYSDGFGREIMSKVQAEPGPAPERDPDTGELVIVAGEVQMMPTDPRWVGTGRTIFDNKGNPVKQYEPFFSDTHKYEDEDELVHWGVTPILHYDPLSRLIRTDLPNGTFSKVEFDPWHQTTWDENDTVTESRWYEERQALDPSDPQRRAADLAAAHADTPAVSHLDVLGRAILTIADNGPAGQYPTHIQLDIEGNPLIVTDARGNRVQVNVFSLLGQSLYEKSMDAGERRTLNNVAGNPIRAWDSRGHEFRTRYDELQRPTDLFVKREDSAEVLAERTVYGESQPDAETLNLNGQLYQQYDGAGVVTSEEYDFKGNPLRSTRQLLQNYKDQVDWTLSSGLETERFTISTTYDALNRPLTLTTPDASVTRPGYNEANLLQQLTVNLRGADEATRFVTNIDYDAKGQRERIEYGSGARTEYRYDPQTFRLTQMKTVRTRDDAVLQDLNYTYDPVGNITEITDDAQQTVFFDNEVVSPSNQYEYDAIYRLIRAEGREHAGQNADTQRNHTDLPRVSLPHANDANALRPYTEEYEYDAVGNILTMLHRATNGNWTRHYEYATDSNRLLANSLPGDDPDGPYSATYDYDEHGNMIRMPHLPVQEWDFKDQLYMTQKQVVNNGRTSERTRYLYDGAGERVRKVTERQSGKRKDERIYLGGFELPHIQRRRRHQKAGARDAAYHGRSRADRDGGNENHQ
jgi:YD repeat-containing protein